MFKFSKIVAALAILPVLAISTPAFAGSPGQLAGGDNYLVKNLTKGGAYANTVDASCNDEVQYSMQLSNTQFGALDNVTLKATLPASGGQSTATATTNLGGDSGTSDTATVNLSSGATQTLSGSAALYDDGTNLIKNLDGNITNGVNIGTIGGSTTKFVNFKAKVTCPTPEVCPPGTTGTPPNCVEPPKKNVVCDALTAEYIGSTNVPAKIKFTAKGTATGGATINGYAFDFGDGEKADGSNAVVEHTYDKEGDYKATAQVKSTLGITAVTQSCTVMIKVSKDKPPVVTPPTNPPAPGAPGAPGAQGSKSSPGSLPSTGPAEIFGGLFGAGGLGYGIRQLLMSRRRLSDVLNQ